ncbi:MAG TPA: hemerythrin domain-containing protein [Pyrinomonadaceae bacterium]|nr:hemerythrin domain-containing protein [Pyrinomonadaceae bacterium]
MEITTLLKEDHREVENLIAQLESGADKDTFLKLKSSLELHTQIEESIYYPALEDKSETDDLITDAYQEHDEVDELLEEMSGTDIESDEFQTLLQQLKDSINHHVKEEENELFPKSEEILGAETLDRMGDEMEKMKTKSSSASR